MRWCVNCQEQTQKIQPPICEICGQPIPAGDLCPRCRQTRPRITAIRSWAEFGGPIRNALHALKYRKNIGLGIALSQHLESLLLELNWQIDLVAPVPLGQARQRERGYNQADLLAKPLAFRLQLPYQPQVLVRARETRSQVDLSLAERRQNVRDAFQAAPRLINGKTVLVIDDVTTTGSTLDSCADALLKAGAKSVYGLTIARATLHRAARPSNLTRDLRRGDKTHHGGTDFTENIREIEPNLRELSGSVVSLHQMAKVL